MLDRIEKSIDIDSPMARVWQLVTEPGWYINDGQIVEHRIDDKGDGLNIVHDPVHGAFAFRTVRLDEPTYAAFRWLADADDPASASTLVEFTLQERTPASVTLTVVESGLSSLGGDELERRAKYEDNEKGWTEELQLAKELLESDDTH